jgi:type II secretory pathway component PulF
MDLQAVSDLMMNGFSFQDALQIAKTKQNENLIDEILRHLSNGEQGETVIAKYLSPSCYAYFIGFIQYMPLKDTLSSILHIMEQEKKQKEDLIKGMLYPSLLFLGVNAGVLLFNSCVLPVMIHMMSSFQYANQTILMTQHVLSILSKCTLLGIAAGCIIMTYCLQSSHVIHTYHWIEKKLPDALLVKYASSQFCRFYLECIKRNLPTRESLLILKTMVQKPLVKDIAEQLDTLLSAGQEMSEAVAQSSAESALVQIFHIAVYASNCETMMEGYLHMVQERTVHEIQLFSRIVQGISYSAVALIIVLVYQVLLMPISMMQTL